jgi:dTDP-4-amino-4,6-dideoxygalactose transaminase
MKTRVFSSLSVSSDKELKPMADKGCFMLPDIPEYATDNAHMFYLVCNSLDDRSRLIAQLKANGILAVFHYLSLHNSVFYKNKHDSHELKNSDMFTDCLVRLPMFYELTEKDIKYICETIIKFH